MGIKCDVLILTECWLSCAPSIPSISGYSSFATSLNPIQNDGVVVYIKNELTFCIEECNVENCNCLLVKVGKYDTAILAVYRSPSFINIDPFLKSLDETLKKLSGYKNVALIGDLNIDIISDNPSSSADQYLTLTAYHGLLPAHSLVTRDTSGTCIDHVLLKARIPSVTIVLQSTLTDHKTVILCLKKEQTREYAFLTHTKINQEGLSMAISKINFDPIYKTNDCNFLMSYVIGELKTALNENSVTVTLARRKKIIKPWITQGLLRCMQNRDKLHMKSKSCPDNLIIKTTYTRYRNFCCSILKKAKRNYDRDLIQKAGKDSRRLWDSIKNITNTNRDITYPKEILQLLESPQASVDSINNYFANVGKTLAEKITPLTVGFTDNDYLNDRNGNSFVLIDTDAEEVERLILTLKNDCSTGWDNLSNKLLKDHKTILVPHLTYIFNTCLSKGIFPRDLKRSQIRPIHKGGDRGRIENYRPISILPSLSKIFEKIINSRLVNYLESKKILSEHQFGFRQGRSTDDAVSNLTNFVTANLDKGNKCLSIFLDLSKAFDTVSVSILLSKLEKVGCRGTQLQLMKDYLSERSQCVRVGPHTSTNVPVTYGVPQGSILGPTLFLVYINDLLYLNSFHGKIISYADDTALIFTAKTWNETYNAAQKGFNVVIKWLRSNLLTLNTEKTKYLVFSIRDSSNIKLDLTAHTCIPASLGDSCQCKPLERSKTIKYLGTIIDESFNFKTHIQTLSKRIRKLVYLFKILRYVVTPVTLKQVYYALCQSLITYCISSWGGAPKTTLKQIEVSQRTILKICTFKPFRYPTALLYEYCEVLTVRQLFLLNIVLKQHSVMEYSPDLLTRRRRFAVCDRSLQPKTSFIQRFCPFLSSFIYNKINKIIEIYPMNKLAVKKAVTHWLMTLSYDETEHLLIISQ